MLEQITELLNNANPDYRVIYQEVAATDMGNEHPAPGDRYAIVEEIFRGKYRRDLYATDKLTRLRIYFCIFEEALDATGRQEIRDRIEAEIITPFIAAYHAHPEFRDMENGRFFYPRPRFEEGETGIVLLFECRQTVGRG